MDNEFLCRQLLRLVAQIRSGAKVAHSSWETTQLEESSGTAYHVSVVLKPREAQGGYAPTMIPEGSVCALMDFWITHPTDYWPEESPLKGRDMGIIQESLGVDFPVVLDIKEEGDDDDPRK